MKKILIKTIDPLIVDYRPGVSNEHETLDYIPASRLRGAFFEFRDMLCPGATLDALLGYGGPRWTHAWPCDEHGNHWRVMPKCIKPAKAATAPVWLRKTELGLRARRVQTETNMSVGRHYGRRANRGSALYARDAISPGQHFVSYVDYAGEGELATGPHKVNIGTRHSANGLCEITISDCDPPVAFSTFDSAPGGNFGTVPNSAAIQLLSDAIVPAPGGGYLRGLGISDFEELAGFPVIIKSAFSASKTVSGWSGMWGLPRESAVAIEAGSLWLLQVEAEHLDDLRAFTKKCLKDGLGIRTYEGFGTVAVNPDWLTLNANGNLDCVHSLDADAAKSENVHPPSWPESTGLDLNLLNTLIVSVQNSVEKPKPDLQGEKLKQREHELRKAAQDTRQWMTHIARHGATDHKKMPGRIAFDEVEDIAAGKLQSAQLFFLTVLETRLTQMADDLEAKLREAQKAPVQPPPEGGVE